MKGEGTYDELLAHFKNIQSIDRAIANYYLYGVIPEGSPPSWKWDEIIANYNMRESTLSWALVDAAEAFRKK